MLWNHFSSLTDKQPESLALCSDDRSLTYGELRSSARFLAREMRQAGFRAGAVAAIFLPNGPSFVCAFMAVLHEGGVSLALNTKYQEKELIQYLSNAQPRVILTDQANRDYISKICAAIPGLEAAIIEINPTASGTILERIAADGNAPALRQYSSGTTMQSKSVERTQAQLSAEIAHYLASVHLSPKDRILGVVPLFHAHGLANAMLGALYSGATLILKDGFRPREILKILSEKKITVFPGVPFIFEMLAQLNVPEGQGDFSSLRLCFSAGAPLDPKIAVNFQKRFNQPVRQLYGTTETGSISINLDPDISATMESVGAPMPGIEIAILDTEGRPLPPGTVGEIGIKSPAMAPGYFQAPDITSRYFRDGWFIPGDLAVRDSEGRIYLRGRKTLFVNVGGNKVDPAEVEARLLAHPQVSDAVVIGAPTASGGHYIKAFVVCREEIPKEKLFEFCKETLAEFKVPKIIEFRNEIPRSPLGKVLRKYLIEE